MKLVTIPTKIIAFIGIPLLVSCKTEVAPKKTNIKILENKEITDCPDYLTKNKENNLNVSILLDLSDRIDEKKYPNPTMEYFQRDLGYIKIIANRFLQHIQKKKLVLMNDKIQIYFEPEPADQTINQKSKELKLAFTKDLSKEYIVAAQLKYDSIPKQIYSIAKKSAKYAGSDTWRFFKEKVTRYCINECTRNVLVILTDGYMYHEETLLKDKNLTSYITPKNLRLNGLTTNKWESILEKNHYGFIPATEQLNDLEVLVIGLVNHDKKRNPYGKDVVKKYWENWLQTMGVKKFEVYGAELPSNIENTITNFMMP
ncbi:hypothetical protein ACQY1Q_15040 [Tenacibaculum sp. TC6]|uniref:hypothetical protein n=1 Tax=Tenacibaculum sp. TC6 TaxID=3423223 RepID=UPI003D36F215